MSPAPGSRSRNPKDLYAGLIYVAIGLAAIVMGRELPMGTALQMGPAYFPSVLGGLLAFIGLASLVRSFVRTGEPIQSFAWRPLLIIVVSTVVFGLLLRGAGLIVALPLFVVMTSFASANFRWIPSLVLAAAVTVFCAGVFVYGLGVPLRLIGRWFGG